MGCNQEQGGPFGRPSGFQNVVRHLIAHPLGPSRQRTFATLPYLIYGDASGVQSTTLIRIRLDARTMAGAPTISEARSVRRERRLINILALPSVLSGSAAPEGQS